MFTQIIILTTMSFALWLASRWVRQEVVRVDSEMRRTQSSLNRIRANRVPRLQLDPATGRYYPVNS